MEKNIAGKKKHNCTVVNFVLFYFVGRGFNLVSGNVYGRVESAPGWRVLSKVSF